MNDNWLLLPLVLIVLGLALFWFSQQQRRRLHMPEGEVIYEDVQERRGQLLISHRYGLKGRPDFLLEQNGQIIPVEAKTGRTPAYPYLSHVMQLIVYCVLVEDNYGFRPAYGVIRYPEQQFTVEFTVERESTLAQILSEMRQKRQISNVHRSHNNPRMCATCGFRDYCDEQLAMQQPLL
ncbi:MAG: CRISPR-associated protein Cas4 [Chloroflexi bacterium]|nr:CRISPR-associated protein Cas4 [Chloroflexota bacterium]